AVATVFGHLATSLHYKEAGIINADLMERAVKIRSDGEDLVVQRPTRFGLGFQLTQPDRPLGPNPGTFGHYGNGGHIGFADPTIPLGFAYHMNLQGYAWRDPRNIALTDAMYACLE
ncbi:MAG: serine hydrolase, partial [Pseudomonadales bacterium]|nr:serine hydrolase [Pseudomonadales bacterium]